jgi:hypothetical protein
METTQTLSMNYLFFTNVGTFTQTIYSYYPDSGNSEPLFRTTTSTVNVPLLGINDSITSIESYAGSLSVTSPELATFQIAPNPATDVLSILPGNNISIQSVRIVDISGKFVSDAAYDGNPLSIAHLQNGIYFAEIQTDAGKTVKKFIKQ